MESFKISVIIPTLNRKIDLEKTLISISKCDKLPFEVIIIDQSDNKETKDFCSNFRGLNMKYLHFDIKSLTLARNYGIENVDKNTDIIQFFDDDILLEKDYFVELENFFLNNKKAKGGVANIKSPSRQITLAKRIGLFLLSGSFTTDKTFVTAGGFNVMPFKNPLHIENVEWTSGCGMFFRKSVFDEGFRFEKRFMKYSLMEDCFLSYGIQVKYPKSLFFVPNVKMTHCESPASRIANKQRIYQNIIHRYYFIRKYNKNFCAYLWTMFIFSIFDLINYRTVKIIKYYYQGLRYIFKNKDKIGNEDFDFNKFIFG